MTVERMDNVGIVVDNLDAAIEFFAERQRGPVQDMYRLCYIRSPEGLLIGLAQQLGQQTVRANPI